MTDNNIHIINYWWAETNYGALLTGYALQQVLEEYKYNSYLIDNKSMNIKDIKKYKKYFNYKFSLEHINSTKPCKCANDFISLNKNASIFITGSDQVFAPKWMNKHFDNYFLNFVSEKNKKIACSASFGIDKSEFLKETSPEVILKMKNALKSFDFVSCREKTGVEICNEVFGVDAKWIIDPVFIVDKSKYEEIMKKASKDYSNKIVTYVLDTGSEYKSAYTYLAEKYNVPVIELAYSNETVENWLSAIKNCDLFVTDSFHGMCFAIIFNKPFICVTNKYRGRTRFDSILEMLKIDYQCIDNICEIYKKDCIANPDYTCVNNQIVEERENGLNFLKKAIETPVVVTPEKVNVLIDYLENQVCQLEAQSTLKYQIKKELWNLWLIVFHKYLPAPIKNIIKYIRGKLCK